MTDAPTLTPDTYVNYCYGGAFIIHATDASACPDCEWFGVWGDAPDWLRTLIRAEYADDLANGELVEVADV